MSNAADRPVSRGERALDVFDGLPAPLRAFMRGAAFNFDPVEAAYLVAQAGPAECLRAMRDAELDIIARTALPAVREVSILRP